MISERLNSLHGTSQLGEARNLVWSFACETGIPYAKVTPEYLFECLQYLDELVRGENGQVRFHEQNALRSRNLKHRLHSAALWMFGLTLGCITIHLLPDLLRRIGITFTLDEQLDRWLTLGCATLPAFGAAMGGISNQGEFARIEKRSQSMSDLLGEFGKQIDALQARKGSGKDKLRLAEVAALAAGVTQLMVDEVVEWRVIFTDRPPTAA